MANSQQVLQAIASMQRDGQERLPIIPNNGNPAGAHNMPQQEPPTAQQAPPPDKYAWLQPSQSVANIRAMASGIGAQPLPAVTPPAVQQQAPILPVRAAQPVVLPQR